MFILPPKKLNEASYKGNLGFEELSLFYKKASNSEKREMEKILDNEDWDSFVLLIHKVTGKELQESIVQKIENYI